MPWRTPMKASISAGLRRISLVRSASLRSGFATIWAILSRETGAAAQPASRRTSSHFFIGFILAPEQHRSDRAARGEKPQRVEPGHQHRGRARGRDQPEAVSYTHLRAHETPEHLV